MFDDGLEAAVLLVALDASAEDRLAVAGSGGGAGALEHAEAGDVTEHLRIALLLGRPTSSYLSTNGRPGSTSMSTVLSGRMSAISNCTVS